ncbi:hypothetical protein SLEP1_g38554 [Rubroshorea leprosula]|nr:hypothetical protein SLEP1_g38554 [Rubroshorea leprosula]
MASTLQAAESKMKSYDTKISVLKIEIRKLAEKLEHAIGKAQSIGKDAKILEQERIHLEQKYLSEIRRFEELEERCKQAEKEVKKATELADKAQAESVITQKEKSEVQRLAMEKICSN